MPKVLLVEDDPLIIRLYTKTLQFEHYEVASAENGRRALELLPEFKPDIILLDIMMPELNGVEFLKRIPAGTEEGKVPVIVLTNVSDAGVTLQAASAGASLVLIKSQTEPDDVISAIKGVLAKDILRADTLEDG